MPRSRPSVLEKMQRGRGVDALFDQFTPEAPSSTPGEDSAADHSTPAIAPPAAEEEGTTANASADAVEPSVPHRPAEETATVTPPVVQATDDASLDPSPVRETSAASPAPAESNGSAVSTSDVAQAEQDRSSVPPPSRTTVERAPRRRSSEPAARGTGTPDQLAVVQSHDASRVVELDVASLHENPHQPRRERDDPSLDELALSVAETGVQEPVKVRRADDRDGFYIVTGHRRTEAARRAGLLTVPARVLTGLDPLTERIVMLDENAMRQDLSVVDKAAAILAIVDHIPHGEKEGFYSRYKVSRPQIHKWRKLLELSEEIQNDVRRGYYTERHARAYWKLPTTAQEVLRARMLEDSPTSDTAVEMGRQVLAALYSAFGDEYMAAPAGEVAQAAAGALARLEPEPQPDESRKRHRADVPAFQRLFTLQRSLSLMSWQEVQEDRRRMNPLLDEIVLTGLKLRRQTGVGEMRPDEVRESRARAQELLDEAAAWLRETPDPDGPA